MGSSGEEPLVEAIGTEMIAHLRFEILVEKLLHEQTHVSIPEQDPFAFFAA